jgi:hypothetical protein
VKLNEIAGKLEADGLGQCGVDLFYDNMPVSVTRGLLITAQVPIKRNVYVASLRKGAFQVISRQLDDDDYVDPTLILENVILSLSGQGVTIGSMNFRYIRAESDPFVFPRSDGDIIEASVNFDFLFTV